MSEPLPVVAANLSVDGSLIKCCIPLCDKTIPNHAWGKIKNGVNWYFNKDGKSFCPAHVPVFIKKKRGWLDG